MLRIFQTGDNHIGMKYASHEKSEVLCKARLAAFENMVKAANENECGLFVITGDLFENTYGIAKRDIHFLIDALSGFQGTVAVLPGNHDYYDPDSKLWRDFRSVSEKCDNIMLLNQRRPYSVTVNDEEVSLDESVLVISEFAEEDTLSAQPAANSIINVQSKIAVPFFISFLLISF